MLTGGQQGMTLIELLVASVLLLVVMGAVYSIWSGLQNTFEFTNDDMVAQDQARSAMGEMVEAIRTARLPLSAPPGYDNVIPVAQRNSIMIWTDINKDANHDLELILFEVRGRALYRDEAILSGNVITGYVITGWKPERLVSPNVSNGRDSSHPDADTDKALWLFTYYDANGKRLDFDRNRLLFDDEEGTDPGLLGEIETPSAIREVCINLQVDIYADRAPVTHQLTSVVQPRNLRQY